MKEGSNKFWFKRKRYGWGWVPVTWQGWLVIIAEVLFLFLSSRVLLEDVPKGTYQGEVGVFMILVFLSISALIFITYKKSPKPKWRWGKNKSDNPKLDY